MHSEGYTGPSLWRFFYCFTNCRIFLYGDGWLQKRSFLFLSL